MYIYTEQEIRQEDNKASKNGLNMFCLMENAGHAIYKFLTTRLNKTQRILILAGKGNNGGDGIVLARYLKNNGFNIELVFPTLEPATPTAIDHYQVFKSYGYERGNTEGRFDVIIDAILGVGSRLPLRDDVASWVNWANDQDALHISIDLPTGVEADTGIVEGIAFKADITIALHGYKPSAFLQPSSDFYGELNVVDIGLPHSGTWKLWTEGDVANTFPSRKIQSHKGSFGTGLLVAGSDEMPGSALLSGFGAMRCGIGKLMIGTTPFASSVISSNLPEATFFHNGLEKIAGGFIPAGIRAAAIGPGLVDDNLIEKALGVLLTSDLPLVIDASALSARKYPEKLAPIILTPHPGEFAKMTNLSVSDIQKNRISLARSYSMTHNVLVVLKGNNTVIAFPDGSGYISTIGNPALAKGGTGDTLTGMILAFLCTHANVKAAVLNAVFLHGKCAEIWCNHNSSETMLASDFNNLLPQVLNEIKIQ